MTTRLSGKSIVVTQELAALKRAAKTALRLARESKTPCYVEIDGRIVDIAAREASSRNGKRKTAKKK